jgi:hypothetical protein
MLFLKNQKNYQSIMMSFFLVSCASRGPSYAAREALYEKLVQPGTQEKVVIVKEEVVPVKTKSEQEFAQQLSDEEAWLKELYTVETSPRVESNSMSSKKAVRSISSHQKVEVPQMMKPKKYSKSLSKNKGDDLILDVVPATSSSSGQGYLLND